MSIIEQQFQNYLEQSGLKDLNLPKIQEVELRRAFYAACGQMTLAIKMALVEDNKFAQEMLYQVPLDVQAFFNDQSQGESN